MKAKQETLKLVDGRGETVLTITLTPEQPGAALYIRSREFAKDKTPARVFEDGMRALDGAFNEYYEALKKVDAARAEKVLEDLGYCSEEE